MRKSDRNCLKRKWKMIQWSFWFHNPQLAQPLSNRYTLNTKMNWTEPLLINILINSEWLAQKPIARLKPTEKERQCREKTTTAQLNYWMPLFKIVPSISKSIYLDVCLSITRNVVVKNHIEFTDLRPRATKIHYI